MIIPKKGTVYLVGAGPGDPDLLTLKAAQLLAHADVIFHDDLVPTGILALSGKQALVVSVGKRCGRKRVTQAAIHEMMISSARRGLAVVRLKSGDPMIFGRAAEEMDALRSASIRFEIIPGITAASTSAALLQTSLTDRRVASKLLVLSGHPAKANRTTQANRTNLTNGSMANEIAPLELGAISDDTTVAIYMPGDRLKPIAEALHSSGLHSDCPCVLVGDASLPGAHYQAVRLRSLARLVPPSGARLLLVGQVFERLISGASAQDEAILECAAALADGTALD